MSPTATNYDGSIVSSPRQLVRSRSVGDWLRTVDPDSRIVNPFFGELLV